MESKKTDDTTTEPAADADYVRVWPRAGEVVPDEYTGQPIEPGARIPRTRLTERRIGRGELSLKPPDESNNRTTREAFKGEG